MIKRIFLGILCLPVVMSGLLIAPAALAQSKPSTISSQGLNVEISPLPIELNAKPGTSVTTDLRVRNSGKVSEALKVSLKTFSTEGADGHIVLHDPTPVDDFTQWVSFSKDVFEAPPGQWQTIKMTVDLPPSAAFGYYYAAQIELANQPKAQPGTTRLQGAVAIFVLLNAEAPGASRKIEVRAFKASHSSYEFLPVNFSVQVRNTGNVHTSPHGNIFIKKGSKQVASLSVNATESVVLPKSNRIFGASWNEGFPVYTTVTNDAGAPLKDAKGQVKTHLKWDLGKASKLRFGHYTAELLLVYNDGQRDVPINGSLSFWVIPWRLLAILLVILAFVAIGFWSTFRETGRLLKKKTNKQKKDD